VVPCVDKNITLGLLIRKGRIRNQDSRVTTNFHRAEFQNERKERWVPSFFNARFSRHSLDLSLNRCHRWQWTLPSGQSHLCVSEKTLGTTNPTDLQIRRKVYPQTVSNIQSISRIAELRSLGVIRQRQLLSPPFPQEPSSLSLQGMVSVISSNLPTFLHVPTSPHSSHWASASFSPSLP